MAEIAAQLQAEKVQGRSQTSSAVNDELTFEWLIRGRVFESSDVPITPQQALETARTTTFVAYDECGCGGGCGYRVWEGRGVNALIDAGPPVVKSDGRLLELRDTSGAQAGVLVEQSVQWGPLR
jgi:hypothetical protein